jgi:hypothetical protein
MVGQTHQSSLSPSHSGAWLPQAYGLLPVVLHGGLSGRSGQVAVVALVQLFKFAGGCGAATTDGKRNKSADNMVNNVSKAVLNLILVLLNYR